MSRFQRSGCLSKFEKTSNNLFEIKTKTIIDKKKTFYDVITNFYLTKKFVSILERLTIVRKPKFMNESHFNLIGDQTFYYHVYQHQMEKKKIKENGLINGNSSIKNILAKSKNEFQLKIKKIFSFQFKFQVFHPFSLYILFMDLLNVFLFFFFFFVIPINLCFGTHIMKEALNERTLILRILLILYYIFDIFLVCNTGYYKKGELITQRSEIFKKYLHKLFWFDLISLLILIEIFFFEEIFETATKFIHMMYFIKIFKIRNIFTKIEELLVVDQFYFNILSLSLLILRLIIVTHIGACIWHLLAFNIQESQPNTITWLSSKNLINENWSVRYIYSFYYVLITMNTVGYGDITPQNPWEVLFCVFFVFLACMMFGYCINCVGTIFKDFYKRESELKKDLFSMNEFMKTQNIPNELQMRIRKYLKHLWKEEKVHNTEQAQKVIHQLSDSLKFELLLEVNGPIIQNIDVFSHNFSEKTLQELIKLMREERYTPGDSIFCKGDYDNKDLFYVKKGCVEIFVENDMNDQSEAKILKELKEGQIFGEIAFFSNLERTASVRSKEFTTLIRIDQIGFKNLIEKNDIDREKYNHIKDLIQLYNNYEGLFLTCYSCNVRNHLILQCPLLHREFFKDVCIRKHIYSVFQERDLFIRKRKKAPYRSVLDHDNEEFLREFFGESISDKDENEPPILSELNENNDLNDLAIIDKSESLECLSPFLQEDPENNTSKRKISSKILKDDGMTSSNNNQKICNKDEKVEESRKKKTNYVRFTVENEKNEERNEVSKTFDKTSFQHMQILVKFDSLKNYTKYFPLNNISFVIKESNRKTYDILKKRKKTHLFIKLARDEEFINSVGGISMKNFVRSKDSPTKKTLRKTSIVDQNWKEVLEFAQIQRQSKERKHRKPTFLKGIAKIIYLFFSKKTIMKKINLKI